MFSSMSFIANPMPVERPPETTTSQVLFTLKTARESSNQVPQTTVCVTLTNITERVAAVVGSRCSMTKLIKSLLVRLI